MDDETYRQLANEAIDGDNDSSQVLGDALEASGDTVRADRLRSDNIGCLRQLFELARWTVETPNLSNYLFQVERGGLEIKFLTESIVIFTDAERTYMLAGVERRATHLEDGTFSVNRENGFVNVSLMVQDSVAQADHDIEFRERAALEELDELELIPYDFDDDDPQPTEQDLVWAREGRTRLLKAEADGRAFMERLDRGIGRRAF